MSHIALVLPGIDRIGGAEQQTILLAKGLHRRGWRVTVVALTGIGGTAAADLMTAGIGFVSFKMRKGVADPRGWIRFHRWLQVYSPEVVHAHLPHAVWMARWSRLAAPIRVVVDTLHSTSTGSWGRRLGYRASDWLTDQVTAVSDAVADVHRTAKMVREDHLSLVSNGVDVEIWHPDVEIRAAVRRELGLENEFLWLAVGRLEPVKDYPTLLQAMAQLPDSARLVIAGAGLLEAALRQLTTDLGLQDRVRFLGFEPNVLRFMQAADGFVLSSRWEGLPMVLLEAAACALPSVVTDVPGVHEAIVPEKTGLLASAGSVNALQEAMHRMMCFSAEERIEMGRDARQLAVEQFSLEAVLNRWETLYADLLRQNPRPRHWSRRNGT